MKYKLPTSICSTPELSKIMLEIQEYAKWFSHYSILARVSKRKSQDSPVMSEPASELIRTWCDGKPINRSSLNELLNWLDKTKRTSPTMAITLAAPATNEIRKTLTGWCRENMSPNIMVNFDFNSTILGGMVVKQGSHVFDWSFKRQILANRNHLPEVMRNV